MDEGCCVMCSISLFYNLEAGRLIELKKLKIQIRMSFERRRKTANTVQNDDIIEAHFVIDLYASPTKTIEIL